MTQEEKAKVYDKVVKKLRRFMAQGVDPLITRADVQDFFPELQESEDEWIEKIRKDMISYLNNRQIKSIVESNATETWIAWLEKRNSVKFNDENDGRIRKAISQCVEDMRGQFEKLYNVHHKDAIAWLEKQGEQKPADKIEPKFHEDDWVVQGCNILKIRRVGDEYYCFETVGGYVDDMLVSEIDSLYHLWTIQDAKDGDVLLSKYNQPFIYNGIFDEECIGAYCGIDKFGNDFLEDTFSCDWSCKEGVKPTTKEQREHLFKKMHEAGYEWDDENKDLIQHEKQSEKKPTDKVELKFHEGDWVVYKNEVCQIVKREEGCNKLVTVFGIEKELVNERNLSTARFWTIADAKDGDVLAFKDDSYILLVKEVHNTIYGMRVSCYCHVLIGKFDTVEYQIRVDGLYPATKEQRDTLFTKMKEAGYEWDAEKKELMEIENETENYKQQVMSEMTNSVKNYIRQKPSWSEEDEKMVKDIIAAIDTLYPHGMVNWLKSLKYRVQPQLKYEWDEEDNKRIDRIYDFLWKHKRGFSAIIWQIEEDANWLKSLKNKVALQKQWKPSKEQIIALRWVLNNIPYNKHKEEINGLLDQINVL